MLRVVTVALIFLGILFAQFKPRAIDSQSAQEQTAFSMEMVEVKKPVDIPESVLQLLRQDEYVLECVERGRTADSITSQWFVGSKIHLDGDSEIDLVVQAREQSKTPSDNRCLLGANTEKFWVFRPMHDGYELLLGTSAHDLEVLNTRTKGYRDIETTSSTADSRTKLILKFDGNRYRLHRKIVDAPDHPGKRFH